ncbi:HU family DNA-binding protein [Luteimonas wenzhouensis]|uniref:HU family DNA-binding protein n=1 Tax=Luteimonas wenzhouensis TaxID=2599615 RepID=UPI0024826FAB|nr:HU family DNA-binding protein [Luteimonas wenzhouensis]
MRPRQRVKCRGFAHSHPQAGRRRGSSADRPVSHKAGRRSAHGVSNMPVNKSELIDQVADKAGLSKADAGRALDAVIDAITAALKRGDSVNLVGFGSFSVKARAARTGLNPRTKEPLQIPASNNPVFKAGKALKDAVN